MPQHCQLLLPLLFGQHHMPRRAISHVLVKLCLRCCLVRPCLVALYKVCRQCPCFGLPGSPRPRPCRRSSSRRAPPRSSTSSGTVPWLSLHRSSCCRFCDGWSGGCWRVARMQSSPRDPKAQRWDYWSAVLLAGAQGLGLVAAAAAAAAVLRRWRFCCSCNCCAPSDLAVSRRCYGPVGSPPAASWARPCCTRWPRALARAWPPHAKSRRFQRCRPRRRSFCCPHLLHRPLVLRHKVLLLLLPTPCQLCLPVNRRIKQPIDV